MKKIIFFTVILVVVVVLSFGAQTYAKYDPYIKDENKLLNLHDKGVVLTDRNGVPFYLVNNASLGEYITLDEIPPSLQHAIIVAEDKNFYKHSGVSVSGIARSFFLDMKDKGFSYGGSTLTQQLVKNTLLTPRKSIVRKIQEALLAVDVESNYSKNKILEMYINSVYYGEGALGINRASKVYFNKKPQDLTLAQSAYLAGVLKYPSLLSPFTGDRDLGKKSQEDILKRMKDEGYISSADYEEAKNEDLAFNKGDVFVNEAPNFALMVLDKLKEKYGDDVVYEGLTVRTTLDLALQRKASAILGSKIAQSRYYGVSNGASVTIDPHTGDVLALVGTANWNNSNFGKINMAISPRQPGSSFKPIVYSIAMDDGLITPSTVLKDVPTTFTLGTDCGSYSSCHYTPHDYDNKYRGSVTVRQALANSLNIPSVEVMERVGIDQLLERAPSFGITSLKDDGRYGKGLSLVLGSAEVSPLEMASAYTTFANNGNRPNTNIILSIKDKFGKQIYSRSVEFTPVISEETAFFISSILSDEKTREMEFGNLLQTPFNAAVKTGTSENFRDVWTIGYTPDLVTAIWVGNSDGTPNNGEPGVMTAAPIWKAIMGDFVEMTGSRNFKIPGSIVAVAYCDASGSAKFEYFIRGTEPPKCVKPTRPSPSSAPSAPSDIAQAPGKIKSDEKHRKAEDDFLRSAVSSATGSAILTN